MTYSAFRLYIFFLSVCNISLYYFLHSCQGFTVTGHNNHQITITCLLITSTCKHSSALISSPSNTRFPQTLTVRSTVHDLNRHPDPAILTFQILLRSSCDPPVFLRRSSWFIPDPRSPLFLQRKDSDQSTAKTHLNRFSLRIPYLPVSPHDRHPLFNKSFSCFTHLLFPPLFVTIVCVENDRARDKHIKQTHNMLL